MAQLVTIKMAQLVTIRMAIFFSVFGFKKRAEIPIFIVFIEHQPKFAKKNGKKKR